MGNIRKKKKKTTSRRRKAAPSTKPLAGFAWSFLGMFVLFFTAATFLPDRAVHALNRFTAFSAGLVLQSLGLSAVVHDRFLALGRFRVEIVPECTPLYLIVLLLSFLSAWPATARKKGVGILAGVMILTVLNTLRIALAVYVGSLSRGAFHILHTYLGQVVMMLAVCAFCLSWSRWQAKELTLSRLQIAWGRLILCSAALFACWLLVDKAYVAMNDALVEAILSWQGWEITLQRRHFLYFETFNLPFFASLVLAGRQFIPGRRVKGVLLGTLMIWCSHVLFRLGNAYLILYRQDGIFLLTNSVTILSQYLLTFVAWYLLLQRHQTSNSSE